MKKIVFSVVLLIIATNAFAQPVQCTAPSNAFQPIPELSSKGSGALKGTLVFTAQQTCLPTRVPATYQTPAATYTWSPQWIRVVTGLEATPPTPAPSTGYPYPVPGPTLRARVGELVQLTLINQIDPGKFPYSIDRGDKDKNGGCDETTFYPVNPPVNDKFPDCFHGSSTVNIHFHGTHVNPTGTGDNVFLQIRPSLRTNDAANAPVVTPATVKEPFDEFFKQCGTQLPAKDPVRQWPYSWDDLPQSWITTQKELLRKYDETVTRKLLPANERMLRKGEWPQFYIGSYPYCFRIPEMKAKAASTKDPDVHAAHAKGMGTAEAPGEAVRPLLMGQAPGTHWYHAHKHGSTAINVANGLAGAFIIEGPYDDEIKAFYGKGFKEQVILVNQLGVTPNLERGGGGAGQGPDKGPSFAVNGRIAPVLKMKQGEVQLWRIVNASGRAGTYFVGPPAGFQWMQLAQDGVQLSDANYKQTLNRPFLLASGNRADILVMAPAAAGTSSFMVQNAVDQTDLWGRTGSVNPPQPQNTIFSVEVTSDKAPSNLTAFMPRAPAFPEFLKDITADEVRGWKHVKFGTAYTTNGPPTSTHTINGVQFSGEVGEVVLLNRVEEWKISNNTTGAAISHPFHIHVNPFQVVEVFAPNSFLFGSDGQPVRDSSGKPLQQYVFSTASQVNPAQCVLDADKPDTWKPCSTITPPANIWWDVFPIPSAVTATTSAGKTVTVEGYFKMRSRFVDYSGQYVLHCHILAHEDRGMMTVVEVRPIRSEYSHH